MKTTQELHIALDLLLQKTSSNWNKDFLPQEYDWFLNQEISKFMKQRQNPLSNAKGLSMFDTLKRVGDLNSLEKTVIISGAIVNDEIHYPLPYDYSNYISSSALVTCKNSPDTKILRSYSFVPFVNTSVISLLNISITVPIIGTVVVFSLADLPAQYLPQDNIPTYKKDFILNNAILKIINKKIEALNSKYNNARRFIQPDEDISNSVTFTYNKRLNRFEFTGVTNTTISFIGGTPQTTVTIDNESYSSQILDISINKRSSVRIVDEESKNNVLKSYLSKPSEVSICGYLREFWLIIPRVPNVIVNALRVTYLRKPRQIDLLLGIDSELPNVVLDEIVANTAQTIQGVIGSDTYEKYARENMLIE